MYNAVASKAKSKPIPSSPFKLKRQTPVNKRIPTMVNPRAIKIYNDGIRLRQIASPSTIHAEELNCMTRAIAIGNRLMDTKYVKVTKASDNPKAIIQPIEQPGTLNSL